MRAGNNRDACRVGEMGASSLSPPSPRRAFCPASESLARAGLFLCPRSLPVNFASV